MAEEDKTEEAAAETPACPVCDAELAPKADVVRCAKCGTVSHVEDLTGERRQFLKAERRKQLEVAMRKAGS